MREFIRLEEGNMTVAEYEAKLRSYLILPHI